MLAALYAVLANKDKAERIRTVLNQARAGRTPIRGAGVLNLPGTGQPI